MSSGNGQTGFLRTFFPNGTVEIRQQPSRDAASIGVAKSGDKVLIVKSHQVDGNISKNWYYIQHNQPELRGWIPAKNIFVLEETHFKTLANLGNTQKVKANSQENSLESIQAFNRSRSLIFGINFMPKYYCE